MFDDRTYPKLTTVDSELFAIFDEVQSYRASTVEVDRHVVHIRLLDSKSNLFEIISLEIHEKSSTERSVCRRSN
jgi:hypothetical protein